MHPTPPWKRLLAEPGDHAHIVQLYQDEEFYADAISHFAAEGFVRGESIILVATQPHWQLISTRLRKNACVVDDLIRAGQLTVLDADATLAKFMRRELPDGSIFKPLAKEAVARARCAGRFQRVRWWGEMVNVLYMSGNIQGFKGLASLLTEVAREERIALFCSYLMDKYDPKIYDGVFADICRTYTHVIPAADYANHRDAVDRAVSDVIGDVRGPLLQSLIRSTETSAIMPSSQGLLLWVKEHVPQRFAAVLARAREIEIARRAPRHI